MSGGPVQPPASRNSPCTCGSGRRYKDCHGAIGASALQEGTPRGSSYRAPATEWEGIAPEEADRLGGLMERALAHQLAGRNDDAAALYREVLQAAPRTHDALHMLGVVELGAGNLRDAERLIGEALALRPAYPTITHNLQLVHDAMLARDRAQPEELCERALPLLYELALSPETRAPTARTAKADTAVHLIGRTDPAGFDDGWLLRRLATLLAPMRPTLWATEAKTGSSADGMRAAGIDAASGFVPRGGVHVFAGIGLDDVDWLDQADADRVIVVCTAAPPSRYLDGLRAIARDGARSIELVFTSDSLAARFGGVGPVLPLPIELPSAQRALGTPAAFGTWTIEQPAALVAGIVGQAGSDVEDVREVDFLSKAAQRAGALAIYDPGRLRYKLGGNASVRCVPRTPVGFAPFVASIDCFVHRPRAWWDEGDGRAFLTAMAAGVAVLCPRESLFAAELRDGVDGLLYDDEAQALQMIAELNRAPAWARSLGVAARERAVERFDPAALASHYRALVLGRQPAHSAATARPHIA